MDVLLNKSINELKANSKAVEDAIEAFLESEGIQVSESEYLEIKHLTDVMDKLDSVLVKANGKASTKKVVKPKSKKTKKNK